MIILFFIAAIYLCMYMTLLFIGSLFEIKISSYLRFIIHFMVIISFVIFSICIKPDPGYDLYRHFQLINNIRFYGYNYPSEYDSLFLIKGLFYLISFFPYNEVLQAISVTITYSIFLYITSNFIYKNKIGYKLFLFSWLVNISLLPIIVSYSGIRSSMAFAIFALATYRDLFQKKKGIFILIWYLMPLFIHPVSIILLGLRVLYKYKMNLNMNLIRFILLIWSFFSYFLINLLSVIPWPYIKLTVMKLKYYYLNFSGDNRMYLVNMCYVIFIILILKMSNRKKKVLEDGNVILLKEYIELVLYFILGSFCIPSILGRLLYFLAFFSLPLIYLMTYNSKAREKLIIYMVFFIFIAGNIMYQYVQIVTHGAYISFDFLRMN